jgi:MarR family transcriptional regulator, 2-MHQ and catechol-resistance regulon repressor
MYYTSTHMNFIPVIKELARAYQEFEAYSSAHIRGLGLLPVQFDVIATLANQPPTTFKQLGEKTLISKSSLTGVVERMVQKGLISTLENPDDARSHLLKLTAKGQKIFDQAFPEHLRHLEVVFQKLSKKQMKEIEESLKSLKSIFIN